MVEVARHQVGAAEAGTSRSPPCSKHEHAAVLEEAAEHAADADVLAQARRRRAAASRCCARRARSTRRPADAAYSSSITVGSVSAFTLMPDPACRRPAAAAATRADLLEQPLAQVERRDEQLAEALRAAVAGEVVEEVGDVGGDVRIGGEEPEVLVQPRGLRVVVARADVDVADAARPPRAGRRASSSRGSSGSGTP